MMYRSISSMRHLWINGTLLQSLLSKWCQIMVKEIQDLNKGLIHGSENTAKIAKQSAMRMCNPNTGEAEQVNFKIKASLGYTESSRLA